MVKKITAEKLMNFPLLDTITLEKMKLGITHRLPNNIFLNDVQLDKQINYVMDEMVYRMSAYVASKKIHESESTEYTYEYRAMTWWNMLKLEKPWLQRIFGEPKLIKVKHSSTTNISHIHVCPHINVAWNDNPEIHLAFLAEENEEDKWTGGTCDICGREGIPRSHPMCEDCYQMMREG